MAPRSGRFGFDGGAATFVGTGLLGMLVSRWKWEHTDFDPAYVPGSVPATV